MNAGVEILACPLVGPEHKERETTALVSALQGVTVCCCGPPPLQHPGLGGVRLLHERHREGVPGPLQGAEDPRLCVDPLPGGETTKAQVGPVALFVCPPVLPVPS